MVKRPAFSMLELIFAIVLIGIAVAGVPRMIERNNQSLEGNIVQEAVFAAAAKAAQILTFRWDANSQDPGDLLSHSKILDIAGSSDLNRTNSIFRVGGVTANAHRRFHSVVSSPVAGSAALDGLTTGIVNFVGIGFADEHAYKRDYRVDIAASYVADGGTGYTIPGGGTITSITYNFPNFPSPVSNVPTSMKMVRITLQENNSSTATATWRDAATLYVYAANIGEIDYFKRTLP